MPPALDTELFDRVAAAGENDAEARKLELFLRVAVPGWQAAGCTRSTPSFGLVALDPALSDRYSTIWRSPTELLEGAIVIGWGPDWRRYVANALRKCRAVAREGLDSLYMEKHAPARFVDPVGECDEHGDFPDGDFPFGGAVRIGCGSGHYILGVSSLTQEEDDLVARLAVHYLLLIRGEGPYSPPEDPQLLS